MEQNITTPIKSLKKSRTILKKKKQINLSQFLVELTCKKYFFVSWKKKVYAMKYSFTGFSKKRINVRKLVKSLQKIYINHKQTFFCLLFRNITKIFPQNNNKNTQFKGENNKKVLKLVSKSVKKQKKNNSNSKRFIKDISLSNYYDLAKNKIKEILINSFHEMKKINSIGNRGLDNLNNISAVPEVNDPNSPLFTLSNKNLLFLENKDILKKKLHLFLVKKYILHKENIINSWKLFIFLFKREKFLKYLFLKKMVFHSKYKEIKPIFEKWRIINEFKTLSNDKIAFLYNNFSFAYVKTIKDEITKKNIITKSKKHTENKEKSKTIIDHSISSTFGGSLPFI